MTKEVTVGFTGKLTDKRSFVAEKRAVVFTNEGDVITNIISVEIAEH